MSQSASTPSGFQGAIGSLPLVDLLQVWSVNGFSGLVVVTSQGRTGHVYYVDGTVVHAEYEEVVGERALGIIIGWPAGSFDLHPNTVTLHRTIQKSLSHLLLEAHREIDEQRRAGAAAMSSPPPSAPRPPPGGAPAGASARGAVFDQIRAIPGVIQLVRFGKDGRPAGDAGPAGEALAAKGLYLSLTQAAAVADAFGLHELAFASVRGARESFVLVHASGQYLCVAVAQDAPIEPVMIQLRALLSRPRAP